MHSVIYRCLKQIMQKSCFAKNSPLKNYPLAIRYEQKLDMLFKFEVPAIGHAFSPITLFTSSVACGSTCKRRAIQNYELGMHIIYGF